MKTESYSHQVVEFLKGKEVGHTFTSRSLHEDIVTTPGQRHIPSIDQVSAALTKQRRIGALSGKALTSGTGGVYYEYTLVEPDKLYARWSMGVGSKANRRNRNHNDLQTEPPQPDLLEQTESMRGEEGAGHIVDLHMEQVDDMAEVKHHIRQAFKAYKKRILHPLPEIAVKSIPTDILADELTRRVKEMARDKKDS